jgi:hypothetical protein
MERVGLLHTVAATVGIVICMWLVLRVGAQRVQWARVANRLFPVRK